MATLALKAPVTPLLRVAEPDTYAECHRIFCVGRNYAEHAREMGHDPNAEPPFFFMKPASAIVHSGATIPYPPATENLHHEAELAVLVAQGGTDIAAGDALSHVFGYAAANDLTRRDLQAIAKEKRRPWDMAKGFDRSCVIGAIRTGQEMEEAAIRCLVNGEVRQAAHLSEMIWPVPDIIAHLSRLVMLQPGDLILTGTPAGVGAIGPGDTCTVEIDGLEPAIVTLA